MQAHQHLLSVCSAIHNLSCHHGRYNIDELAEQGDFTDSCYALLHGELPTAAEKQEFIRDLTQHTMVHEQLIQFYKGFRHDAHPMAIMVGVTGALSAFYANASDIGYTFSSLCYAALNARNAFCDPTELRARCLLSCQA